MTNMSLFNTYGDMFDEVYAVTKSNYGSKWYLLSVHNRCVLVANAVANAVKQRTGTWGDTVEDRRLFDEFVMNECKFEIEKEEGVEDGD